MRGGCWFLSGLILSSCSEPGRPAINGCTYASDCAAGESCVNGTCLPISKPTDSECMTDGDCTSDRPHCDQTLGTCRECTSNAHCPTEWTCDATNGRCMATMSCVDGGPCSTGCLATGCPNGDRCNEQTGQCEPAPSPTCTTSSDCPSLTPICAGGQCEPGCDRGGTCLPPTPMCDLGTGLCYGCASNGDCAEPTPSCDVATGECYGCRSKSECSGTTPVCDTSIGVCVGCVANSDCPPSVPICDAASCRTCTANSDCGAEAPVCHLPSGVCVGCASNADCGGNTPICEVASGSCRGCTDNFECGGTTPICHVPSGLCLECVSNADCPQATPTCEAASGTCVILPPQPLGATCASDLECLSEVCWTVGSGGRCVRSCNQPADCDNGTTCHMLNGARICLDPRTAPAAAEDVECTTDADCGGANLCAWVEDAPGHFDQLCRGAIGANAPQTQCNGGNQCENGVCTIAVNQSGAFCRYTCSTDVDCPSNFACVYIDYPGQSYVQAVKACLPVPSPDPPVCGVDNDCDTSQVCGILDLGSDGSFIYWSNACISR